MIRGLQGHYEESVVAGEKVRAYVPDALPPSPELDLAKFQSKLDLAECVLESLNDVAGLLPGMELLESIRRLPETRSLQEREALHVLRQRRKRACVVGQRRQ